MTNILPINATKLERTLSSTIIDNYDNINPQFNHLDPDNCKKEFLNFLAYENSVDNWDINWTTSQKRKVIKASFDIHKYKGSVHALKEQLKALNIDMQLIEWFDEKAINKTPHTFAIRTKVNSFFNENTDEGILNKNFINKLKKTIDKVKNARSHYSLEVEINFKTTLGFRTSLKVLSFKQITAKTNTKLNIKFKILSNLKLSQILFIKGALN